jgi:release factor glutamine methyltransferase
VPTARELLRDATQRLRAAGVEAPAREAALLLRTLLGMSASALLAHDREPVAAETAERFGLWIARRGPGGPAADHTGTREFFGREFAVDARVLVPRPESEHLIEAALALPLPERAAVLDVGTGSGCLAVTLAAERPHWRLAALDRSLSALAVARANAARHGLAARVALFASDLTAAVRLERFDLLVANLPYVDGRERAAPGLAHEPGAALFAGRGGRAAIERLLGEAAALPAGAWLVCEIGHGQAGALLAGAGPRAWEPGRLVRDLAGRERVLLFRRAARGA